MQTLGTASAVRTRILEAAWQLIDRRGSADVSLLDIGRAAGVSRQTVYVNFGNRAGLLLAMVEYRDATSPELTRLKQPRPGISADELLESTVRGWFKYLSVIFKVANALSAAAATDPDARKAFDSRMQLLRGGLLAHGWSPQSAADWSYNLLHIDTWQHLVIDCQWRPQDLVQRALLTLKTVLLHH
jgi:AcrR family transcriptional regulator